MKMNRIVLFALFAGSCLAFPQGSQPVGNPYVKILNLESFQSGANYGHSLTQEDGTSSGQKIGPDGLVYGFYSYIQQDGNPVKVYYRAGQDVGYEVLKVEGLNEKNLGNLRAHTPTTPQQAPVSRPKAPSAPRIVQPGQQPVYQPIHQPVVPAEPTPAPHRFDYPANIQLQRTGLGFRSSFKAL